MNADAQARPPDPTPFAPAPPLPPVRTVSAPRLSNVVQAAVLQQPAAVLPPLPPLPQPAAPPPAPHPVAPSPQFATPPPPPQFAAPQPAPPPMQPQQLVPPPMPRQQFAPPLMAPPPWAAPQVALPITRPPAAPPITEQSHRINSGRAGPHLRQWIVANLRVGQVACWQLAFALVGVAIARPMPVAGIAAIGAVALLALTAVRLRERWLYEWAFRWVRFRLRDHERYLPREGGSRALLHLLAPDATIIAVEDLAVLSRLSGATAVLRPTGADVFALPRPESLLPTSDDTLAFGIQVVFHGVSGGRQTPWAWLTVQAFRTPDLAEEEELAQALHNIARRVLRQLSRNEIGVVGIDEAAMLHTLVSLTHVSDRRSDVREQWRCWCCGSIAQAGFRLAGWSDQDDDDAKALLRRLLTANTGAVLTIGVAASVSDGVPEPEVATMRVAAPSQDELERSVGRLRELAARHDIRLDRMDGQHAEAVAASLPLGARL